MTASICQLTTSCMNILASTIRQLPDASSVERDKGSILRDEENEVEAGSQPCLSTVPFHAMLSLYALILNCDAVFSLSLGNLRLRY